MTYYLTAAGRADVCFHWLVRLQLSRWLEKRRIYAGSCTKSNRAGSRPFITWKKTKHSLSDLTQDVTFKNRPRKKKRHAQSPSQTRRETRPNSVPVTLADKLRMFTLAALLFPAMWRPCGKMAEKWRRGGLYWQMKCVQSPPKQRHPPKSRTAQQRGLDASHSEAFYSLWISVKSLSSQTALYSAPLFSTLGGHFTSNSVKEWSQLNSAESAWFAADLQCLL